MSVSLKIDGLAEFQAALRTLPDDLAHEAEPIVNGAAQHMSESLTAKYTEHRHTGNLAQHVRFEPAHGGGAGTIARVKSTARHAYIVEHRSENRRKTSKGWNRGFMTPLNIFIPLAVRFRRQMVLDLVAFMRRQGFTITGV